MFMTHRRWSVPSGLCRYTTLRHITSHYVTLRHITSYYATVHISADQLPDLTDTLVLNLITALLYVVPPVGC